MLIGTIASAVGGPARISTAMLRARFAYRDQADADNNALAAATNNSSNTDITGSDPYDLDRNGEGLGCD